MSKQMLGHMVADCLTPVFTASSKTALEEAEAVDPNSAQEDGLTFLVEDVEGDDDDELDPAEIEFVEDIPAEVRCPGV